jgi:hypothetical protein
LEEITLQKDKKKCNLFAWKNRAAGGGSIELEW